MPFIAASRERIRVGYISKFDGYISGLSIDDANSHEKLSPGTTFIFVNGDGEIKYLNIDQVNELTSRDLRRTKPCNVGPSPCGPPTINFFGGGGIGAAGNPVIDQNGTIMAIDMVNKGVGYATPPRISVIDPCNNGSGANLVPTIINGTVDTVIVQDGGSGYLPSGQPPAIPDVEDQPPAIPDVESVLEYPTLVTLTDVIVTNPGINYSPTDEIVITPNNGTTLTFTLDPFGKVNSVKVNPGGNYTSLPDIYIDSDTGLNARFVPVFDVIRDPLVPQVADPGDVVQVYDLVGLRINGYVDGKPYYGNVFYDKGIKYAGVRNTGVRVYESLQESITKQVQPTVIQPIQPRTESAETSTESTEVEQTSVVERAETRQITTPTQNITNTTTTTTNTSPSPSPAPAPAPSPAPSPSSGGGYGGY